MKKIKKILTLLLIICVFAGIGNFINDEKSENTTESAVLQEDTIKDLYEQDSDELNAESNDSGNKTGTSEKSQKDTDLVIQDTDIVAESSFEVHYIDVGQADASLVMCDGKYMLIDGGNAEDSSLIYAYLKEHGIRELDYMICTHAHEDHVGGLAGALNYAQVNNILCPTKEYDTRAFESFKKYANQQNKEIIIPTSGMEFSIGSADCIILAVNTVENDPNNSSIVMKVSYGNTSFLFSGDAEQEVERAILEAGYDINCTVMKVPHHGSDSSLSYRWLNESMPKYGVISVGKDNQYGHPTENTLSKLRDADVIVYRTDMQGHIVCISDGNDVEFVVQRNQDANTLENSGPGSKNEIVVEHEDETKTENQGESVKYILNTNTKKIHYPSCSSVDQMKEKNKQATDLSKEELISQGYSPCGRCKP